MCEALYSMLDNNLNSCIKDEAFGDCDKEQYVTEEVNS